MKKRLLAILLAAVMVMALLPTAFAADSTSGAITLKVVAADGGIATFTFSSGTMEETMIPLDTGNVQATVIVVPQDVTITLDKAVEGKGYMLNFSGDDDDVVFGDYYYSDVAHGTAGTYLSFVDLNGPFFAYYDEAEIPYCYDMIQYTTEDGDPVYICLEEWCNLPELDPAESEEPGETEEPGESEEPEEPETTEGTFSDVDAAKDYFAEAVEWAAEKGYIQGNDGKFFPNSPLTRGAVFTILARMDGEDTTPEVGSDWYQKGLDWAVENNVSYGDDPEGDITLEQLVTMLWRYMDSPEADASELDSFSDKDSVSDWAADGMAWAVETGLVKGNADGTLTPGTGLERGRGAVVLQRFYEDVLETEVGE